MSNTAGAESRAKEFPGTAEEAAQEKEAVDRILSDMTAQAEFAYHTALQQLIELGGAARTESGYMHSATGYFRASLAREAAMRMFAYSAHHPLAVMDVPVDPRAAEKFLARGQREVNHRKLVHSLEEAEVPMIHLQLPCCETVMAVEDLKGEEGMATHVLECTGCLTEWFVKVEVEQLTLKDASGTAHTVPLGRR